MCAKSAACCKVNSVLEGSLRRNRDVVRVHVQLIDVNDGCQIWGQKYERRLTDVFEVQDEIAAAIVNALKIELPRVRRDRRPTSDPQAHTLYVKGRYWWHRWNPDALRKRPGSFSRPLSAIPPTPRPTPDWRTAIFLQGFWGYGRPRDIMPRAQAAARKALELDPLLAEAHCSLGMIESYWNWNNARSEAEFLCCMELNPGYALAKAKYATSYLTPLGRFDEAREWLLRALELDPLSPNIHADLALNYAGRGLHDQFEAEAAKVIEMDPDVSLKMQGLRSGAVGFVAIGPAQSPRLNGSCRALRNIPCSWCRGLGLRERWDLRNALENIRNQLEQLARTRYVPPMALVMAHAPVATADTFFALVDRALEERDPMLRYARVISAIDRFRSDPRFLALLEKVGLGD